MALTVFLFLNPQEQDIAALVALAKSIPTSLSTIL